MVFRTSLCSVILKKKMKKKSLSLLTHALLSGNCSPLGNRLPFHPPPLAFLSLTAVFWFLFNSNYIQKSIACWRQCFVPSNPVGNRWKITEKHASVSGKKCFNIYSCPCTDVLHTSSHMEGRPGCFFLNYPCKAAWKELGWELWTFQNYFNFKAFWKTIQFKTFSCCFP